MQQASTPPETASQPVTVEELDQLVQSIATLKQKIDALGEETTARNKELMALQAKAYNYLRELGREDFKSPTGTLSIKTIWNVTNPKTEEDKSALFAWMREKGIYDAYASVNAVSLKSLFMAERDAYLKAGGDPMLFTLPGMEPAKFYQIAQFTKARKSS